METSTVTTHVSTDMPVYLNVVGCVHVRKPWGCPLDAAERCRLCFVPVHMLQSNYSQSSERWNCSTESPFFQCVGLAIFRNGMCGILHVTKGKPVYNATPPLAGTGGVFLWPPFVLVVRACQETTLHAIYCSMAPRTGILTPIRRCRVTPMGWMEMLLLWHVLTSRWTGCSTLSRKKILGNRAEVHQCNFKIKVYYESLFWQRFVFKISFLFQFSRF